MDWKAAHEQQENALRRILYMFVFMTLLVLRPELHPRERTSRRLPFVPASNAPDEATPAEPSASSYVQVRVQLCALLCLAEVALRRLDAMARTIHELMNLAHALAALLLTCRPIKSVAQLRKRLDTS